MPTVSNHPPWGPYISPGVFPRDWDTLYTKEQYGWDSYCLPHAFNGKKYAGMELQYVGMEIQCVGMKMQYVRMELQSVGMEIQCVGMELQCVWMEILCVGLELQCVGMELQCVGMDIQCVRMDAVCLEDELGWRYNVLAHTAVSHCSAGVFYPSVHAFHNILLSCGHFWCMKHGIWGLGHLSQYGLSLPG